ncbi:MAG: methylmalonyl Co-A mutase-associated GTPase MeaB [Chloroflexi bacterium]|nr:methylmalonyl Co-A mutase-associated GTPase MeaB [Chloroflexota bacterium]
MNLVDGVLAGDRLALSRLLTAVENDTPAGRAGLDALFAHTGRAYLVGITGSPGTGKSSLVNRLAKLFRNPPDGRPAWRVAVVAVDPTSPFTGGAVLGDRVRMRDCAGDPGVFIRSMASRGALGGLAVQTAAVTQVFDAAGYDVILIETVGAGQAEVDIASLAHTTLVVEAPGLGDDIQAIKAGILEIADVLVINKADLAGADNTRRALQTMLERAPAKRWPARLVSTVAVSGTGMEELFGAILDHYQFLKSSQEWQRRDVQRLRAGLDELIRAELVRRWREDTPAEIYESVLSRMAGRKLSPFEALDDLLTTRKQAAG